MVKYSPPSDANVSPYTRRAEVRGEKDTLSPREPECKSLGEQAFFAVRAGRLIMQPGPCSNSGVMVSHDLSECLPLLLHTGQTDS